jgi:ribosome-binding ATPase
MSLSVGIVGLPNAGKSTLFNALTKAGAAVGNYPFTTIEPNTGMVPVPDARLARLAELFRPPKVIPAMVTFTDIAGLVRGASRGEGLGNKFLGHIRESDAIALVVRDFEDSDISHVEGTVDPVRDIDVVELELQLADLETITKRLDKVEKTVRLQKEKATETVAVLQRVRDHLDGGAPVRTMEVSSTDSEILRDLWLLTAHPMVVVVNVAEGGAATEASAAVRERAGQSGADVVVISARIEAELAELDPADRGAFLTDLGIAEPGLDLLARHAYGLLDLVTFFTAGEKEVRAWQLRRGLTALDAAGSIHTDFAKGFIRAEVSDAEDLLAAGSYNALREQGKQRLEGRDYLVRDGDVVHFRFNV